MSIRTTVTLDEDVIERVKAESRSRGVSFRDTLNELVRKGLNAQVPAAKEPFRVKPFTRGLSQEFNYDDIEGLISQLEGEDHR